MLACLQGLDGDLHMPVVGGDDAHHIDIGTVEHAAVIAVDVGLSLADRVVVAGLLGMLIVDIANGDNVAERGMVAGVACAHGARADTGDPESVSGCVVGKRGGHPRHVGHHAAGGRRRSTRGSTAEKSPPCGTNALCHGRCS